MKNRNSIIARIRALQAKTVTNGCTEAEALAAAEVAARLITEYDVSVTETDIREDGVGRFDYRNGNRKQHESHWVAQAVGEFCDCHIWRDGPTLVFVGAPNDTAMASWLMDTVKFAMNTEWQKYLQTREETCDFYGHPISARSARASFMRGMSKRVAERLRELLEERRTATAAAVGASQSQALVAVKKSMATQWMADNGIRLSRRTTRISNRDGNAFRAGGEAGAGVGFSRPVGGGGPLMIG